MDSYDVNRNKPDSICRDILLTMNKCRLSNQYCDAVLVVDNNYISVHRVVLAATSKYFKAVFDDSNDCATFQMDWVSAADMLQVVDFMYTGQIAVTTTSVASLKATAEQLEIEVLLRLCDTFTTTARAKKICPPIVETSQTSRQAVTVPEANDHLCVAGGVDAESAGSTAVPQDSTGSVAASAEDRSAVKSSDKVQVSNGGQRRISLRGLSKRGMSPRGASHLRATLRGTTKRKAASDEGMALGEVSHDVASCQGIFEQEALEAEISQPDESVSQNETFGHEIFEQEALEAEMSGTEVSQHEISRNEAWIEAMSVDEMPNSKTRFPCVHCSKTYARKEDFRKHMLTKHRDEMIKCKSCGHESTSLASAQNHEERCLLFKNKKGRRYMCTQPGCTYTAAKVSDTLAHFRKQHTERTVRTCDDCGSAFNDVKDLLEHRLVAHGRHDWMPERRHKLYSCPDCDFKTFKQYTFKKHNIDHKADAVDRTCKHCDKSFSSEVALRKHEAEVHDGVTYNCPSCEHTYLTAGAFHTHMFRAHGVLTTRDKTVYKCQMCAYTHVLKCELARHERQSHSDGALKTCADCGIDFNDTKDFLEHMLATHDRDLSSAHRSYRLYACAGCDFETFIWKVLRKHEAIHQRRSGQVACDLCKKNFVNKDTLRRHKFKVHLCEMRKCANCEYSCRMEASLHSHMYLVHGLVTTKNKTVYKCSHCTYTHVFNSEVRRHEHIHMPPKHCCPKCPYRCTAIGNLRAHVRLKHASKKPFTCEFCHTAMKYKRGLKKHMEKCPVRLEALLLGGGEVLPKEEVPDDQSMET